jgi:steroid 5-alpha reductase family enzyme
MSPFERAALAGIAVTATLAFLTWLASLKQRDVSLVDRAWPLLVAGPAIAYAGVLLPSWTVRTALATVLLAVWAVRLALYIAWRNWGHGEDRRYQQIRARNQPNFALKSLVLVFALQAVLAWLVSAPVLAIFTYDREGTGFDAVGAAIVLFGIVFEAVGDQQLARFKRDAANRGQVMDRGLWRYTRHPNYFGEFCVWWGFFVMALPLGSWSLVSPLIMSALLLKVSGVALLEKDIGERRPAYREYVRRTNAFFPGPRKPPVEPG